MKIEISAGMLCSLCQGKFTYEACEVICSYMEECCAEFDSAPTVYDICISFAELPADWTGEYDKDNLIAHLANGNVVISQ